MIITKLVLQPASAIPGNRPDDHAPPTADSTLDALGCSAPCYSQLSLRYAQGLRPARVNAPRASRARTPCGPPLLPQASQAPAVRPQIVGRDASRHARRTRRARAAGALNGEAASGADITPAARCGRGPRAVAVGACTSARGFATIAGAACTCRGRRRGPVGHPPACGADSRTHGDGWGARVCVIELSPCSRGRALSANGARPPRRLRGGPPVRAGHSTERAGALPSLFTSSRFAASRSLGALGFSVGSPDDREPDPGGCASGGSREIVR